MNFEPRDIVAIGLLAFILLYVVLLYALVKGGFESGHTEANKEIVIYIVGVLSGYIGFGKTIKDKNDGF